MTWAGTGRQAILRGALIALPIIWGCAGAAAEEAKSASADTANPVYRGPGIAMHGKAKYKPGFKHFDYVNPTAPKGGRVKLAAVGTFDSLNPFIIKGTPVSRIGLIFETLMATSEAEPFMNAKMRAYFRQKLLDWKTELLHESTETLQHLQEVSLSEPDLADRASLEADRSLVLRTRDRERKLIAKIEDALRRIEDGSYGYCEETAEPISLRRLEARPVATLSLEAQERHERMERTHRDD